MRREAMAHKKFTDEMIAGALSELPLGPHRIQQAANALGWNHRTVLNFVHRAGIHPLYAMPEQAAEPIGNEIEKPINWAKPGRPLTERDREMIKLHEAILLEPEGRAA